MRIFIERDAEDWVCDVIYRDEQDSVSVEESGAGALSFRARRPSRVAAVREVARQMAERLVGPTPTARELFALRAAR